MEQDPDPEDPIQAASLANVMGILMHDEQSRLDVVRPFTCMAQVPAANPDSTSTRPCGNIRAFMCCQRDLNIYGPHWAPFCMRHMALLLSGTEEETREWQCPVCDVVPPKPGIRPIYECRISSRVYLYRPPPHLGPM